MRIEFWILAEEDPSGTIHHWAPDQPDGDVDENCATFSVGLNYGLSGFWEDEDCNDVLVSAICERVPV